MSRPSRLWVSHWFNTVPQGSWRPWLKCQYTPTLVLEDWQALRRAAIAGVMTAEMPLRESWGILERFFSRLSVGREFTDGRPVVVCRFLPETIMSKKRPYDNITTTMLRAAGWKVTVEHHRRYVRPETILYKKKEDVIDGAVEYPTVYEQSLDTFQLHGCGGLTKCVAVAPQEPGVEYVGYAKCLDRDNYGYKRGTRVALRRALHAFWNANDGNGDVLLELRKTHAPVVPEMRQTVVLSVAHLTAETLKAAPHTAAGYYLDKTGYGALSFVHSEKPVVHPMPDDLWECHAWVNKHIRRSSPEEAVYILFDEDGPLMPGLANHASA